MMRETDRTGIMKAHVALNVSNVTDSISFYRKFFGVEPVKVRAGYAKFDIDAPALNFTLNQAPGDGRGSLSHLGIQVDDTEAVIQFRDRWLAEGLEPREEMRTNCCYALQDKAWVVDPDGNQWEAFTVLEDNLAQTSTCCGTAGDGLVSVTGAC